MFINKQYIVFIWIILLLLFLFYCIFRIKYIHEKYYDISYSLTTKENRLPATTISSSANIAQTTKSSNSTLFPTETYPEDIYAYIDNIKNKGNVTDMPNCKDVYDDNIAVGELGYNSCETAYADYLDKNLDVNKTYGMSKSLANICPVSSKTDAYKECLTLLLDKFTKGNNIIDNINTDMTSSVNKRIQDRSSIVTDIQTKFKSFLSSKDQIDFNNNMLVNGNIANYPDERIGLVDNYYQSKYKGYEIFTNLVYSDIENKFFGNYLPVKGQYISLNNLVFSLYYDNIDDTKESTNSKSRFLNLGLPNIPPPKPVAYNYIDPNIPTVTSSIVLSALPPLPGQRASSIPTITSFSLPKPPARRPASAQAAAQAAAQEEAQSAQAASQGLNPITIVTKPVVFSISNNDLYITYNVENIDYYKNQNSAVILVLNNKNIVKQNNSNNTIQQLLSILGLNEKSQIIISTKTFTSTEGITHTNYTLVNDNLDTILVLEKLLPK